MDMPTPVCRKPLDRVYEYLIVIGAANPIIFLAVLGSHHLVRVLAMVRRNYT